MGDSVSQLGVQLVGLAMPVMANVGEADVLGELLRTVGTPAWISFSCRDGLAMDPGNAYFAYLQGAAWWSLGESDLALQAWRLSIKQRPDWLSPGWIATWRTSGWTGCRRWRKEAATTP